jgi:hypothetical protein
LCSQSLSSVFQSQQVPDLLGELAFKEEVAPIFIVSSTYRAARVYFHATMDKLAAKGLAIMRHTPKKVFHFVWTVKAPNLLPDRIYLLPASTLSSLAIAIFDS